MCWHKIIPGCSQNGKEFARHESNRSCHRKFKKKGAVRDPGAVSEQTTALIFRLAFSYLGKGKSARHIQRADIASWSLVCFKIMVSQDSRLGLVTWPLRPGALCITRKNCNGVANWIPVSGCLMIKKLPFLGQDSAN